MASVYMTGGCDECGREDGPFIGQGPGSVDVLAFCPACLGVRSVAHYDWRESV